MKPFVWLWGIIAGLGLCSAGLRAGTISFLDGRPEVRGKLTLNATAIHVEGPTASDIKLPDILEASFTETDFHLDYFSSEESPAQLPTEWQGHNIGTVPTPGSSAYANGDLKLTSSGDDVFGNRDKCYYMDQPWKMDEGQWTMRVKERSEKVYTVGFMLRTSLEPGATMFAYGLTRETGFMSARYQTDTVPSRDTRFASPQVPGWIRLTRYSNYLMDLEISIDGKTWDMTAQDGGMRRPEGDVFTQTLAGVFVSGSARESGTVVLDQIMFTPSPAEPEMVRSGVLLRSGSFLAGNFNELNAKNGSFNRHGKNVTMTLEQVAAVTWQPTTMRQLTETSKQTGVIMKNGDFMASDLQNLSAAGAQMTSVVMGPMDYIYTNAIRACLLNPLQFQSSLYEVRLKDGSFIRAAYLEAINGQLAIHEVSGPVVTVDLGEIAQFRAGPSRVQPLIGLPWKAASVIATAATESDKTKPASDVEKGNVTLTDPAMKEPLLVQGWQGPNQEQIMAINPRTALEFPLTGKFRGVAMKIALLSAKPEEKTFLRILADGKEIGRIGPVKAGDQPQLVERAGSATKSIGLVTEGASVGTKILVLDAVAIRE